MSMQKEWETVFLEQMMSVLMNWELGSKSWSDSFTRERLDKVGARKVKVYGII